MQSILRIKDLHVAIDGKEILKGVNLEVEEETVYVLFGPNGSGKTTLMNTLVGFPGYAVNGNLEFQDQDITSLSIEKRANLGLNISFQHAPEVKGVTLKNMLNICRKRDPESDLDSEDLDLISRFRMQEFLHRDINVGFSGGERKRADILQLLMQKPKFLLLDEPDSGVDIESLKLICREISAYIRKSRASALIITHQGSVLEYITSRFACVLADGKIHCYQDPLRILQEIKDNGYSECIGCKKNACECDDTKAGFEDC